MNTYTLFWIGGKKEIATGDSISDAFSNLGYGGGAIRALDFYSNCQDDSFEWDKESREWVQVK